MGSAALFWGSCCLCRLLRSGHIPGALARLERRDARNYFDSPSPVLGLIALARVTCVPPASVGRHPQTMQRSVITNVPPARQEGHVETSEGVIGLLGAPASPEIP